MSLFSERTESSQVDGCLGACVVSSLEKKMRDGRGRGGRGRGEEEAAKLGGGGEEEVERRTVEHRQRRRDRVGRSTKAQAARAVCAMPIRWGTVVCRERRNKDERKKNK